MEKYRDGQRELHCVFVDLEKAYDRVPREELWYCMRKSGVAEKYVRVVQDMYERSRTVVRCAVGQTEEFKVEVGLHQGSALSPFLFAIVMDQLSEEVRQESPWTIMFADDIVICSESREQMEENLERWRFALERRGMKLSRSKTEYMCVNDREGSGTVRLQGEEVKKYSAALPVSCSLCEKRSLLSSGLYFQTGNIHSGIQACPVLDLYLCHSPSPWKKNDLVIKLIECAGKWILWSRYLQNPLLLSGTIAIAHRGVRFRGSRSRITGRRVPLSCCGWLSMFLLYNTQKMIEEAETYPLYAAQKYDPMNASWPQYVKDRIHSTYMYFAGSVGMTTLSIAPILAPILAPIAQTL
ncbi:hypothetical protein QTP86_012755, partial [Hemibagrus guttatus]